MVIQALKRLAWALIYAVIFFVPTVGFADVGYQIATLATTPQMPMSHAFDATKPLVQFAGICIGICLGMVSGFYFCGRLEKSRNRPLHSDNMQFQEELRHEF